jgi:hypothetical protein
MITTIRSIGQFSAENFNDSFTKNLLSYNSNQYTSIAEALRISKIVIKLSNQCCFYIDGIDACHPKTENQIDKSK